MGMYGTSKLYLLMMSQGLQQRLEVRRHVHLDSVCIVLTLLHGTNVQMTPASAESYPLSISEPDMCKHLWHVDRDYMLEG